MEHKIRSMAGGRPFVGKTILDKTQQHAFTPFTGQLCVHSLTTRQLIRSLKFDEENNIDLSDLVGIQEDMNDGHIVWCFKANGDVLLINWKDKLSSPIIKTYKIDVSSHGSILKIVNFEQDSVVLIVGKDSLKAHTRTVISFHFEDSKISELFNVKNVLNFAISNDSQFLAFLSNTSEITKKITTIYNLTSLQSNTITTNLTNNFMITCLAVSNDGILATGNSNGVINVYENSSIRTLRWHVEQVKTLSFTNDSSYLLSGGIEKVLVFWQLDTEKQQFLPRLNGEIVDINTNSSEFHNLTLKLDNHDNFEVLILSAIDLQSRLLITGPKQILHSNSMNMNKLIKNFIKKKSKDSMKLKYDFTSVFKVHPVSKQLYFLNGSNLQIYDIYRKEQVSVLRIANAFGIGKVKSELKLNDTIVKDFIFTKNGEWLITLDEYHHGEVDDLLSKNDFTYTLKFWKLKEEQTKNGSTSEWVLISKIINPHGVGVPVLSMIPGPESYFKSQSILTADNHGGVRLWRPNTNTVNKSITWTLRKLKNSTGISSNSINLSWSNDASLIFLGVDYNISVIDVDTFEEINNEITERLSNIAGSSIKYLDVLDNHLVILSKSILKTIDLLSLQETDLNIKLNTPNHGAIEQISINHTSNLIALIQNFYDSSKNSIVSKILIFSNKSKKPIFESIYPSYITSIKWNYENDFVFLDINSRVNVVTTSNLSTNLTELHSTIDHNSEIAQLLTKAESSNVSYKAIDPDAMDIDNSDEINGFDKRLDINSFFNLFENIEGDIKLETMFERVMQVIN